MQSSAKGDNYTSCSCSQDVKYNLTGLDVKISIAIATKITLIMQPPADQDDDSVAPEWGKSEARDYLFNLIVNEEIPGKDGITPREVFDKYCKSRPEFKHFQDYKAIKFADKLRQQRTRAGKKKDRAKEDDKFYQHDRQIFPPRTEDTGGEPVWAGSKAQEYLRIDLQDNKRSKMKPKALQNERDEYLEWTPDKFRDKIYQEKRAMKRIVWMEAETAKMKKRQDKKREAERRKKAAAKKKADKEKAAAAAATTATTR